MFQKSNQRRNLLLTRGSRRKERLGFQFWKNWFAITCICLAVFKSLTKYQDAALDFLVLVQTTEVNATADNVLENGPRYLSPEDIKKRDNENKQSGEIATKEKERSTPLVVKEPAEKMIKQEKSDTKNKAQSTPQLQTTKAVEEEISIKDDGQSAPELKEEVYFLNNKQLSHHDGFSASWLQTREDFLSMPFDKMDSCEMVSFRSFDWKRQNKMRMTLDWMQFSVEHMSKWWKILEYDNNEIVYQKIVAQFQTYLIAAQKFPMEERIFQNTIAVIAFQAYTSRTKPEQAHNLTALSLAATMESLRRAGFGRVVVAVLVPGDIPVVDDAFKYIVDQFIEKPKEGMKVATVGHMEIGYAYGSKAYTKTNTMRKNIPRATVMTLRDAILHSMEPAFKITEDMKQNITAWLGDTRDPSYWKYVYLTEPDSLLQARHSALPAIKAEIDKGNVVLPHRWQPIPHESDVRGMDKEKGLFLLEGEFPEVLDLDPNNNHDACCDENQGKGFKPGDRPFYHWCGARKFWYSCGLLKENKDEPDKHRRLKPYKLMRLMGGTQITTIAGSEHARRCFPKKNGVCRLEDVYETEESKNFDALKKKYVESLK